MASERDRIQNVGSESTPRIRAELDLSLAQLAAIEKIIDDGLRWLSALDDRAAMSESAE